MIKRIGFARMLLVAATTLSIIIQVVETLHAQPAPGAPAAEVPKLTVGETWQWTYGTEKLLGAEGDYWVFEYNVTRRRYRTRDLNLVKTVAADGKITQLREPHSGYLNFPLYVEKGWSHFYDSDGVPRRVQYTVAAYEKVAVRAGTFMAFRIDGEDKRLDRRYGILISLWYSPEMKAVVKMEGVDGSNNQPISGSVFELVKYAPSR